MTPQGQKARLRSPLNKTGRIYPATAYLHEQSSDLARGLLLREESKPLGEKGFFWLCVSIASNWAGPSGRLDGAKTDKIPLEDRYHWVLDNEEIIMSYAMSPKVNQGWMTADKPWMFLAACIELRKLREFQMEYYNSTGDPNSDLNYEFESSLEVYVDGSCNGKGCDHCRYKSFLIRWKSLEDYTELVERRVWRLSKPQMNVWKGVEYCPSGWETETVRKNEELARSVW